MLFLITLHKFSINNSRNVFVLERHLCLNLNISWFCEVLSYNQSALHCYKTRGCALICLGTLLFSLPSVPSPVLVVLVTASHFLHTHTKPFTVSSYHTYTLTHSCTHNDTHNDIPHTHSHTHFWGVAILIQ